MVTGLRLALRLVRGGGGAGLIRLTLMTVGFGFGAVIILFLATIPNVLSERGRVTAARYPILAEEAGVFRSSINFGSWHGKRFTRVLVADVATDAPRPPGVDRLPAPGEVVLSPAAVKLALHDPNFAKTVPGQRVGQISSEGLLGPDELFAYVGVAADDLPSGSPSRGWGGFATDPETRDQFAQVPLQLLLIVAPTAVIYFSVCSRISAATRRRRYAALRLVGMSRRQIMRIAAVEAAVPGVVGATLGLAGYQAVNSFVGPAGPFGFSWYPSASALSLAAIVGCVVALALGSAVIGGLTTARAVTRPVETRFDAADRPPRWWYAAPFFLGLGLISFPLLLAGQGPQRSMDAISGGLLVVGVALSAGGLLLAVRPGLVALARSVAGSRTPLTLRLAARRVEYESAGLARHLAGLSALVLVAGIGAGVLRQTELSATPSADRLIAKINSYDVPVAARSALARLPAEGGWTLQKSITLPPEERPLGQLPTTVSDHIEFSGVTLLTADCATVRRQTGQALNDCQTGRSYRVQPASMEWELPPGTPIRFLDADGGETTISVPRETIDLSGSALPFDMAILAIGETSPLGITADTFLFYQLSADIDTVDRFVTELAGLAPAATISLAGLDLGGLEAYRVHRGVIGVGVLLAFLLGLAAFLISTAGRAVERRRDVTSLVVVGAPRRTLRAVQWTQTLVPLVLVLMVAGAVGHLAGNALLRLQGQQFGWFLGTVAAVWPMVAISLVVAAFAGFIVVGLRPRAEDLRRE